MIFREKMTQEIAFQVYQILIEEVGAPPDEKQAFVYAQAINPEPCVEFRFCGALGFGGKFWNDGLRWYVTCYKEEETLARQEMIKKANERLSILRG